MNSRILKKCILVGLVALIGLGLGLGLAKIGATKRPVGSRQTMPSQRSAEPSDSRPLKERAKLTGRYVGTQAPHRSRGFADLKELTDSSASVIVGIPQSNISALTADGKSATLDYAVKVMYVYKGGLREGSTITVSLPGGKVQFEDGSSAEIQTPWFKKMMSGNAYVLFLTPTSRPGVFVTTGDAQGVFEIPKTVREDPMVKTHSGMPSDSVRKYEKKNIGAFLKELRKATGKKMGR